MQYEVSQEVEKVANKVIREHHPDLAHKTIHYLKLDKKDSDGMSVAKWSKGHQIAAEIKVLSGDAAFLISKESRTDDDGPTSVVVLKVYSLPWNNIKEDRVREALIDSQLCRLVYDDETGKPSILEYDAKVHNSNLKRFGAWNNELLGLWNATKELPLFEENGKAKVQKAAAGNSKAVDGNGHADKPVESSAPVSNLEPIKETVAKKRGGRAVRV